MTNYRYTAWIIEYQSPRPAQGYGWGLWVGARHIAESARIYDSPRKARRSLENMLTALGADPTRLNWAER